MVMATFTDVFCRNSIAEHVGTGMGVAIAGLQMVSGGIFVANERKTFYSRIGG